MSEENGFNGQSQPQTTSSTSSSKESSERTPIAPAGDNVKSSEPPANEPISVNDKDHGTDGDYPQQHTSKSNVTDSVADSEGATGSHDSVIQKPDMESSSSIFPKFSIPEKKTPGSLGVGMFFMLTVLAFLAALMISLLLHGIRGESPGTPPTPTWMGIEAVLGSIIWIPVALLGARWSRLQTSHALSWRWPSANGWKLFFLGGAAGLFMLTPAVWLQQISSRFLPKIGTNLIQQLEKQDPSLHALLLISIAVVIAAPLAEEMFFRGFAFRGLITRKKFWPAAILVSIVFAVIHIEPANILPIFVLSLVLCWFQWRTSSVIPPIIGHATYNGVQIVAWLIARNRPDFDLEMDSSSQPIPISAVALSAFLLIVIIYGVMVYTPAPGVLKKHGGAHSHGNEKQMNSPE